MLKHNMAVIWESLGLIKVVVRLRFLVGVGPIPSTTYIKKSSHPDPYFSQL